MKKNAYFLLLVLFFIVSCKNNEKEGIINSKNNINYKADTNDRTNDFYDNEKTYNLKGNNFIEVTGEVANPDTVYFSGLPLHSVIIKEAVIKDNKSSFKGAYRYDGYSLYDILNNIVLKKKNQREFPPIVDLYIKISNDKGEYTIISWGELYYPVHRHEIIIAAKVMRIVPSKSHAILNLPEKTKLIVCSDLLSERNISNPTKITIKSLDTKIKINRNIKPLYSPELNIYNRNKLVETITKLPANIQEETIPCIFYGRGRGIHGITSFKGDYLKNVLGKYFEINKENLQHGIFVISGIDGYRAAFTFSEIMNRNDNDEVLLIDRNNYENAGKFSLFASADFFSDRAIKAINQINYLLIK